MPIQSLDEHVAVITTRMGNNAANVSSEGLESGATTAMSELGWVYPVTNAMKEHWAVLRGIRHSLFILQVESAHKFRYKDIFLQNRFAHYTTLIEKMDKDYEKAKEDNPDLFADSVFVDDESIKAMVGYYIPNYSDYDELGRLK